MTVLEETARWVAGLAYEDIPERVLKVARHQMLSTMGAVYAGAGSQEGKAVIETVEDWGQEGPCSAYPSGAGRTFHSALFQNCSLSMALDYDDYLFLAHTGHSAVFAPLAVAEIRHSETRDMLMAQVIANEVSARLGSSVVFGPLNGQMVSHVHLIGAAAAASRLMGLDAEATADAIGIALAEPVHGLFPGFLGAQSKVLTAAIPTLTGVMAAFTAARGLGGSRVILEDPEGLWAKFCFMPLPNVFSGLGRAWLTDTIAFKAYPGCAYIDTAVDALIEITEKFKNERGRPIEPDEVREIDVGAGLVTVAMEAMSADYLKQDRILPVHVNFSIALSLAVTAIAGELTGSQFTGEFLRDNRERILALASRVNLRHEAKYTVELIRGIDEVVDMKASLRSQLRYRDLWNARHRLREYLSTVTKTSPREIYASWRSLPREDRAFLKGIFSLRGFFGPRDHDFGDSRFEELRMPFGARVTLVLKDGTTFEAERALALGAPGDPTRFDVPVEKFRRESAAYIDSKDADDAVEVLLNIEENSLDRVRGALSGIRS